MTSRPAYEVWAAQSAVDKAIVAATHLRALLDDARALAVTATGATSSDEGRTAVGSLGALADTMTVEVMTGLNDANISLANFLNGH